MDQGMYNLNEVYNNNSAESLLEKSFRRKVFFTVSLVHVIFIIGPFVGLVLCEKLNDKRPPPMLVSLINVVPAKKITDEPPGALDSTKNDVKEIKITDKKEAHVEESQLSQ